MRSLIRECVDGGELVRLPPLLPNGTVMRDVFVTHQVDRYLRQAATGLSPSVLKKAVDTRLALDRFSLGKRQVVRLDPNADAPSAQLARNHPTSAGIWEFRIRDPKPQIRVFGGFALQDTFVALDYRERAGLDFDEAVRNALDLWRHLFKDHRPVTGENINDYLSDRYHLV